jgi:hypothetical protein
MMTRQLAALALLAGCAATADPVRPQPSAAAPAASPGSHAASTLELPNAGFEAEMGPERNCPPGWGCTMHNNPRAFRFFLQEPGAAGSRSLCIERVADEPWALVTQLVRGPALRGARLRLSVAVRTEGVSGEGAGPWALVQAPHVHALKLVRGSSGWQRVSVDLAVPAGASEVEIGATLEGPGKACFDDIRLEILGPV